MNIATGVLATALPVGIVLGFGITPLFVKEQSDMAKMNWIWFIPAVIVVLSTSVTFFRNGSKPPTPPSKSADVETKLEIGLWTG